MTCNFRPFGFKGRVLSSAVHLSLPMYLHFTIFTGNIEQGQFWSRSLKPSKDYPFTGNFGAKSTKNGQFCTEICSGDFKPAMKRGVWHHVFCTWL